MSFLYYDYLDALLYLHESLKTLNRLYRINRDSFINGLVYPGTYRSHYLLFIDVIPYVPKYFLHSKPQRFARDYLQFNTLQTLYSTFQPL